MSVKVCGNTVAYQQFQLLLITEAIMLFYIVVLTLMVAKYDTACVVLPIWLMTLFMTSNEALLYRDRFQCFSAIWGLGG